MELKSYKINHLNVENEAIPGSELKLKNTLNYKTKLIEDSNTCVGILDFKLEDDNDDNDYPFLIDVEMVAEFSYNDEEKEDVQEKSFDQVFPYLRVLITQIASLVGIPGLVIPIVKLNTTNN